MDPFQKLSPEIQTNLLLWAGSLQQAVVFTHASPALFRQNGTTKVQLSRHYIGKDLDNNLIQDALAIIMFLRTAPEISEDEWVAIVEAYLHEWGAKGFLDSTQLASFDMVRLLQLESVCSRLRLYMEDYLYKASHQYLPRAYRWLPRWSHPDFPHEPAHDQSHSSSSTGSKSFDLDSLTRVQRRQLFQAFLRYELLCKIYGPIGGISRPDGRILDEVNPFRYWNWRVLYKYEKKEPEQSALQLLPCVREYVLTLYGALVADQAQAYVPFFDFDFDFDEDDSSFLFENAPWRGVGPFPDYLSNSHSPWGRRDGFESGWSDPIVSLMASTGFDLLTGILTSASSSFHRLLRSFNREQDWDMPFTDVTNVNVNLPLTAPSQWQQTSFHCHSFTRLYRQRAWALWEEGQCRPRLPRPEEYTGLWPGTVIGRAGWWWERDDQRNVLSPSRHLNEKICHGGGVKAYPSLLGKMMPFWKNV